jgi:ketosteroid isomerase-like protein
MIPIDTAQTLAQAWIHAWNQHDLDGILSHYSDEIEFFSPFIIKLLNNPTGSLVGKAALREYFQIGLNAYPDLHFDLQDILIGVDSLVLYYRSVNQRMTAEYMEINPDGLIYRVCAHYNPRPDIS